MAPELVRAAAPPAAVKTGGVKAGGVRTVFTGDVINGKKVVSSLNTDDLEPGRKHFLYFQGVQMSTGQYWYVSVIVAKGIRPGKRFTLTSGVHGDEMSSVHTVQTIMGRLKPAEMTGTVMAVLFVDGTLNVLKHYGVIPGPIGRTAIDANVLIGQNVYTVVSSQGGFIEWLVKITDNVRAGQKLAIQRNAFGEVLAEYTSPVKGRISALRSDATSEPGNVLVFILSTSAPASGSVPYAE
jgi:predicted deacylase